MNSANRSSWSCVEARREVEVGTRGGGDEGPGESLTRFLGLGAS
jgi:hypothetical protein